MYKNSPYQQCTKCVMDNKGDDKITFDENGVCNYCHYYENYCEPRILKGNLGEIKVIDTIKEIKNAGKNCKYDCIIGLSGGVDSSYLAYWAKQKGLHPLCVHFDNGWNSELAVKNIENIVTILGFDLQTFVIDWEEFKSLQRSYISAGVIDIEALTDHAIYTSLFKISIQENIRFVLSGFNLATEGILPYHWTHKKSDYINILDIYNKFGDGKKLKSFPLMKRSIKKKFADKKFISLDILNWLPYNKQEAKQLLIKQLNWKDYGGKHYESVFTKFYQAYILPIKFNVDKRKAHLSTLICSNQISREEALIQLKEPLYTPEELKEDKEYVLKKLGYTEEEFDAIMKQPQRNHLDFNTEGSLFHYYPYLKPFKPIWNWYKNKFKGQTQD